MNSENTLKIIIPSSDSDSDTSKCIICLHDSPNTITYSGLCSCHPQIHEQCMAQWFTENPGACPICRKSYTNNILIQQVYRSQRPTGAYVCCCLCFFCVFIGPFTFLLFLAIKHN